MRPLIALLLVVQASGVGCGSDANPAAPTPSTAAISGPFAAELTAFDQQDKANPYPPGGVVFVGSSSIRFWNLETSFPGRNYLNRGFGGSQISDSITYIELLVLRHAPRTVVFYAGDNDIASGKTPAQVAADFVTFARELHATLPATRILFLAIKASIARVNLLREMQTANRRIAEHCDSDGRLIYVDVHTPMLAARGETPRPELLVSDGLHLSAAGYALWTQIVMQYL